MRAIAAHSGQGSPTGYQCLRARPQAGRGGEELLWTDVLFVTNTVADIVQCGLDERKALWINRLTDGSFGAGTIRAWKHVQVTSRRHVLDTWRAWLRWSTFLLNLATRRMAGMDPRSVGY